MTPEDLRALADTVAWQDRTDLHGAMLGAADAIDRLAAVLRRYRERHDAAWDNMDYGGDDPSPCRCGTCATAAGLLRELDGANKEGGR